MITDFQKAIASDITQINTQIRAKKAEVDELLKLFAGGFAVARAIIQAEENAKSNIAIELVRILDVDLVAVELTLNTIATQITILRQEITSLRRQLANKVSELGRSITP